MVALRSWSKRRERSAVFRDGAGSGSVAEAVLRAARGRRAGALPRTSRGEERSTRSREERSRWYVHDRIRKPSRCTNFPQQSSTWSNESVRFWIHSGTSVDEVSILQLQKRDSLFWIEFGLIFRSFWILGAAYPTAWRSPGVTRRSHEAEL